MKYFTKEELEEITEKLIENPTRETLKELDVKYNTNNFENSNALTSILPEQNIATNNIVKIEEPTVETVVNPLPQVEEPTVETVVNPLPQVEEPTVETVVNPLPQVEEPTVETVVNPLPQVEEPVMTPLEETSINLGSEIPSFEVPKQVVPEVNNNSEVINFTGNLWEPQNQNNLMSTTDNFNTPYTSINEVPVQPGQFFGSIEQQVNNPIPVNEAMPHIPVPQGPSMFGQFEQNYNG